MNLKITYPLEPQSYYIIDRVTRVPLAGPFVGMDAWEFQKDYPELADGKILWGMDI